MTTLKGGGGGAVTRVGVALSGGGHRASVGAAGLLLYLADAGRNGDVGVIASVSGGSIANGVVAQQMDYRQARADEVREGLGPLLHHIAYTGLFFWGPSTAWSWRSSPASASRRVSSWSRRSSCSRPVS